MKIHLLRVRLDGENKVYAAYGSLRTAQRIAALVNGYVDTRSVQGARTAKWASGRIRKLRDEITHLRKKITALEQMGE